MKTLSLIIAFALAIGAACCTDLVDQEKSAPPPQGGLVVQTSAEQYRQSDTVWFTVLNKNSSESRIPACNLRPMYWLQHLEDGVWRDYSRINEGPCLALFPFTLLLAPERKILDQLPLETLDSLQAGAYRIRVEYSMTGSATPEDAYSNGFQIRSRS